MTTNERALKKCVYGISTTLRVDKAGIENIADELDNQFCEHDPVKVNSCMRHTVRGMTDELVTHLSERRRFDRREIQGNTTTDH